MPIASELNNRFWDNNEHYLKAQEGFLNKFQELINSAVIGAEVKLLPDIVVVYNTRSDIYYRYRVFSKSGIKAFVTTQVIIQDVRTGLIPFTTLVTRELRVVVQCLRILTTWKTEAV